MNFANYNLSELLSDVNSIKRKHIPTNNSYIDLLDIAESWQSKTKVSIILSTDESKNSKRKLKIKKLFKPT
jgi:hypothetical protein